MSQGTVSLVKIFIVMSKLNDPLPLEFLLTYTTNVLTVLSTHLGSAIFDTVVRQCLLQQKSVSTQPFMSQIAVSGFKQLRPETIDLV